MHAGTDVPTIQANLDQYAVAAKKELQLAELGVGLWLPAEATTQLLDGGRAEDFSDWLSQRGLRPYTINGFPYDNFHQPIVKHRVYEPGWWTESRRDYTIGLALVLDRLLPPGELGSISTLPIGWPSSSGWRTDQQRLQQAAQHLHQVADRLHELEQSSGRRIVVAIEPEPGCLLDTADDVTNFFEHYLQQQTHRRYLTVCHDICHSAVMFEDQLEVLRAYAAAGLTVGKVQVSSAIEVHWAVMSTGRKQEALRQLTEFAEDRYLHQTGRYRHPEGLTLAEDLFDLTQGIQVQSIEDDVWRVHFHVPIFLEAFGNLASTQQEILRCLRYLRHPEAPTFTGHLEVETYAWSVLPAVMRRGGLDKDIAREMSWLRQQLMREGLN